ncbi:hypothetical protein RH915_07260 [Serpentinicella sp. ANB-PHB4]|uniref:hypothetical protein n=1 Tax=Serpentinicella sp. ANB-PHB4 TaxID=3074076 RepID=UPI002854C50B|nr:hypothetical protein [Serpentinicella sp. ANB-PHB4]MDR5659284.1 hypothetical protein [Serpentinicella sp. ANB-PHB4]
MKKRYILTLGVVIAALGVGTVAYAQDSDTNFLGRGNRGFYNHCFEDDYMQDRLRENGYDEMAEIMENGDIEGMRDYMINMTDEEFESMQEFMREEGYGRRGFMPGRMMGGRRGNFNTRGRMMGF